MLLGGLRYLKPVIEAAHKQGYYVITTDNVPDNVAHRWSDEYCNVSVIDKDAVLQEAQRLKIDGIMSFACDPGVVAAAYVQDKMGLPSFGPFESIKILQDKGKFRAFLKEHGFNVPWFKCFDSVSDAFEEANNYPWPVMVKPTDAAGSKGVSRVEKIEDLSIALEKAVEYSLSRRVIVEEFIEKRGCSSDADCMSVDGKLVVTNFNAQLFDANAANPYTPAAFSWPSTYTQEEETYLSSEIQRLITLLGLKTVLYNIETRIGTDGRAYIMEMSPRGGGNRISEMMRYANGVDMITAITRAMVGDPLSEPLELKPCNGHWAEIILHSDKEGVFDHLEIGESLFSAIVEKDIWVGKGDKVEPFEMANRAIGTLVLKFQTAEQLEQAIYHQQEWITVETQQYKNKPLVSILVPIFNVEPYIENCARSIFEQTYSNLEFVFVNDGSTDESIECLEKVWDDYPNCNAITTIVHHPRNKGLAAARNTAIAYCHGDYVVHVDSDDWIEPDAVELLVKRQQETIADLVYTKGFYRHKMEGTTKEDGYGWFPEKEKLLETFLQDKATISIWSKLIKKNLYTDNVICCNEQGSYYEDFQVLSRLIYYSISIACLDAYIYHYNRTNPSSIVANIPNNIEIQRQGLRSIQEVCDFFQDKEPRYLELVKRFYICYLYRMLNTNHRYNNREGYDEFWNRLEQFDKSLLGLNIQISKPNYTELIDYMFFQVEDAFPLLRDEEIIKAFTIKLYKNAEFCICRDKGELVGMIAYYANGKGVDFAYLAQAYVSPDYRKKGLFSRMLSNVEEDLIKRGFHEIRLEVDKQNENALNCYQCQGFAIMNSESRDVHSYYMNKTI